MEIPKYPEFAPIDFSMRDSLYPALNLNKDGISEFTFAGLYLFRKTYDYKISSLGEQGLLLEGTKMGRAFSLFCAASLLQMFSTSLCSASIL